MSEADALAALQETLDNQPVPDTDRIMLIDGRMVAYRPSRETVAAIQRINEKYDVVMERLAKR
jgi:hypothetical protein